MREIIKLDKINVLVVEDLSPMRDLLVHMLRAIGIENVSFASDGKSGFQSFCSKKPDIVITDWHMPEMDGIELIKKIRQSEESPNRSVPVLMMSGFCSLKRISAARDRGVTEFLVKPFSAKDLSLRIAYMIKNPRDFIVTHFFSGPDRRRKKNDDFDGTSKRQPASKDLLESIPADKSLQVKVGIGRISDHAVARGQKILDENTINFIPIAEEFIKKLEEALRKSRTQEQSHNITMIELTAPIMQIKANAKIFHQELVGDLAAIILNFMESLASFDKNALDIIEAHIKTLQQILKGNINDTNSQTGQTFKAELKSACNRYKKLRAAQLQHKMRQELEKT